MAGNGLRQAIHITLRGRYNITYSGTLILHGNVTSRLAPVDDASYNRTQEDDEDYDATGASYFVVAVVLVYGMSIVALIASHIKRRHEKITEDKQIDKYLQDFQIIKEVHARDNYKNLKKSVMNKINWDRKKGTHRTLQKSILPLLAIGMQVGAGKNSSMELIQQEGHHKGKRKVYPIGTKRHSDPDISDSTKLIESSDPRPLRVRRHSCMDRPYVYHEQAPPLNLLTIPDTQFAASAQDSASARRLRFSASSVSVSHLARSLNSIAEREEDEEKDATPPPPIRASSASVASASNSLELPATTVSKANKLRRIGVSLAPSPDAFLDPCPTPIPTNGRANEDGEISVIVDDVWARDEPSSSASEGEDASSPMTSPNKPVPVSIMVEDEEFDEHNLTFGSVSEPEFETEMVRPPMTRQASVRDEEEDFRLTPQTLLASIKFTGGTLTPNGSPRRSRSSSITSLMPRRGSKDRRRSVGSGGRDFDGLVEVIDDNNPFQITCL